VPQRTLSLWHQHYSEPGKVGSAIPAVQRVISSALIMVALALTVLGAFFIYFCQKVLKTRHGYSGVMFRVRKKLIATLIFYPEK